MQLVRCGQAVHHFNPCLGLEGSGLNVQALLRTRSAARPWITLCSNTNILYFVLNLVTAFISHQWNDRVGKIFAYQLFWAVFFAGSHRISSLFPEPPCPVEQTLFLKRRYYSGLFWPWRRWMVKKVCCIAIQSAKLLFTFANKNFFALCWFWEVKLQITGAEFIFRTSSSVFVSHHAACYLRHCQVVLARGSL